MKRSRFAQDPVVRERHLRGGEDAHPCERFEREHRRTWSTFSTGLDSRVIPFRQSGYACGRRGVIAFVGNAVVRSRCSSPLLLGDCASHVRHSRVLAGAAEPDRELAPDLVDSGVPLGDGDAR
jgi:hypothetical protein